MRLLPVLCFALCVGVSAVSVTGHATPTQDDLRRIEAQLREERKTQQEAKQKSNELADEIKKVQTQMVRSAKAVQEKENQLAELQQKLNELTEKEKKLNQELSLSDKQLAEVATALQRLALRPPEVMLMEPQAPIVALRSRMMLAYALPQVRRMNSEFIDSLAQLSQTKANVEQQTTKVKTTQAQLNERTSQMNKLIRQKALLQAEYNAKHNRSGKRIVALASQAKDLKELLDKLAIEKAKQEAARAKQAAEEQRRKQQLAQQAKTYETTTAVNTNIPKGSFQKAKGALNYPVKGQIIENFNDITEGGLHSKGMRIQSRAGSTVTNLYNGNVLFAGPFKSYGHLLIMDNGDDYLTLLAGMSSVSVSEGQRLIAGEPVGKLQNDGKLYLEIRKNSQPIDPKPWFTR